MRQDRNVSPDERSNPLNRFLIFLYRPLLDFVLRHPKTMLLVSLLAIVVTLSLSGCGYNDLQRQDEQVKSAWSEVLNQYTRRADLVPNLVNTVKCYAAQE